MLVLLRLFGLERPLATARRLRWQMLWCRVLLVLVRVGRIPGWLLHMLLHLLRLLLQVMTCDLCCSCACMLHTGAAAGTEQQAYPGGGDGGGGGRGRRLMIYPMPRCLLAG